MPTTTTTTTTTNTQVSTSALSVGFNPHHHYEGYWTATISTSNCTKHINADGAKFTTVMRNVQSFLDEVRDLRDNPAAKMAGSLPKSAEW
jgi:hypothetical protein